MGLGSRSIGASLNSCDDDAAVCGADAAVVTLLSLSPFWAVSSRQFLHPMPHLSCHFFDPIFLLFAELS